MARFHRSLGLERTEHWASRAVSGHCGETTSGNRGDCSRGEHGQLLGLQELAHAKKAQNWTLAAETCIAACHACGHRCRYVSLSVYWRDCSWYYSCARTSANPRDFITIPVHANATQPSMERLLPAASTGRRDALSLRGTISPWLQPNEGIRVAVLLFGAIGGTNQSASVAGSDAGDAQMVRAAHASLREHVLQANPQSQHDLFCHSWNPTLAPLISELYRPLWSRHERRKSVSK